MPAGTQPTASFDPSWESEIYSKGRQVNRYPFGELVSIVLRYYAQALREGQKLRVLELGSGSGNNLQFFAKEGFETYGIDGSSSACEYARQLLASQSLKGHVTTGDFVALPYDDNFFDLVVDREAVYCNRKSAILQVSQQVMRCLKPGGRFLSFAYSTEHGGLKNGEAEMIEPNTYTNFKRTTFQNTGVAHFFTESEIKNEYFKGFEIEYLHHHKMDNLLPEPGNLYAEFIVSGKKPARA